MNSKDNKQNILNIPNLLSLLRMILVPVFITTALYMPDSSIWSSLVPAFIFALTALTDMLDGMIARKYGLVTDFGKFLDPLADKFMVLAACITILCLPRYAAVVPYFVWVAVIILFRELAVTSLRLVVATKQVVIAASFFGKAKTCTQIAGILLILTEPCMGAFGATHIVSYVLMAAMVLTTVGSGADYFRTLWPYLLGKKD